MAYGARTLGSRSRGSSRGSHVPPERTREACTGRSTTGSQSVESHAVRERRIAIVALTLPVTTGERRDMETVMRRCVSRKGWRVQQETVLPR